MVTTNLTGTKLKRMQNSNTLHASHFTPSANYARTMFFMSLITAAGSLTAILVLAQDPAMVIINSLVFLFSFVLMNTSDKEIQKAKRERLINELYEYSAN